MGLYIILMGVQGAGKGMQAGYISEAYGIPHVSTGDMFRAMKTREDDLAKKVQALMAAGQLIDDETTNAVVADRLSQDDAQGGVILDGYPRNQSQAEFLAGYLEDKGEKINAVLLLDLPLFIAFKRAFGRVTATDGQSYNYYYKQGDVDFNVEQDESGEHPPRMVAKLNGEELKRRPDDADAMAVVKRIDTYLELTQPVLDYYEGQGVVYKVDANQSIDAVTADIKKILDGVK